MGRHLVAVVILHTTCAQTMNVYYCRFSYCRATWEACSGNLENKITGTIPAFALGPRKTKKNLCRDSYYHHIKLYEFMIDLCTKFTCLSLVTTIISKAQENNCTTSMLLFYIQKLPNFYFSFRRSINIAASQSVAKGPPVVPQLHAYALQKRHMRCVVIHPTACWYWPHYPGCTSKLACLFKIALQQVTRWWLYEGVSKIFWTDTVKIIKTHHEAYRPPSPSK
jgi:hypothetical protein